jgi:acyl carrier protein
MSFPSLDEVVQQLRTIVEDDDITAEAKIAGLEIDSLDVLEWVFEIEEQSGMTLDESLYDKDSLADATIRDFYDRVKSTTT